MFIFNIQTLMSQRIETYPIARVPRSISHPESLSPQTDNSIKTSLGRLSISQNSDSALKETRPVACRCDFHFICGFVPLMCLSLKFQFYSLKKKKRTSA